MQTYSVLAKNRPSPANEDEYIEAYKKVVPSAAGRDNKDIAAVITSTGIYGHALMYYTYNRGHDSEYHTCYHFVSDDELRRYM